MSSYRAPLAESRAEIREKGSVFLAVIGPAADEAAAKAFLARLEKELPGRHPPLLGLAARGRRRASARRTPGSPPAPPGCRSSRCSAAPASRT